MIVISHGKGHPASGFGGAVKHLGMGCLARAGKIKVHEVGRPSIDLINEQMKKSGKSIYNVWGVDPFIHLEAAEKIGCGNRKY